MPRAATHAAQALAREPASLPARRRREAGTARPPGRKTRRPAGPRPARRRPAGRGPARRRSARPRPKRRIVPRRRTASTGAALLRLPGRSASGFLDRLVRGRAWVLLIGVLLVGIVFLNVHLLQLGGGIATVSERVAELKRTNDELRLEVARLGSSDRIQRAAAAEGFHMPAPDEVTYLEADPAGDGQRAARALGAVASVAPPMPPPPEATVPTAAGEPEQGALAAGTPAPEAPSAPPDAFGAPPEPGAAG
jgi:cell division protein FtsL